MADSSALTAFGQCKNRTGQRLASILLRECKCFEVGICHGAVLNRNPRAVRYGLQHHGQGHRASNDDVSIIGVLWAARNHLCASYRPKTPFFQTGERRFSHRRDNFYAISHAFMDWISPVIARSRLQIEGTTRWKRSTGGGQLPCRMEERCWLPAPARRYGSATDATRYSAASARTVVAAQHCRNSPASHCQ